MFGTSDGENSRTARWSLRLFGGFELEDAQSGEKLLLPGKRERVLLAYLALAPHGREMRRRLVNLLWGEAADDTSLDNLRTCVFNLRKSLGDRDHRIVASDGRDIVLDRSAFEVDALMLRHLEIDLKQNVFEAAANIYRGEFLEGIDIDSEEFESWRREEASRFADRALHFLTLWMSQFAETGQRERAIETGLRVLRLEPLHEPTVRLLMRIYAEGGRRSVAMQLYRRLEEMLSKELSVRPEPETSSLFSEIFRYVDKDASTLKPADTPHAGGCANRLEEPPLSTAEAQTVRTEVSTVTQPGARRSPPKFAWMPAGAVAAVMMAAFLIYELYPLASESDAPVAIAVLPFANLSGDPGQDYFADGMTEEILSTLVRVPQMTVRARTSALEFRGSSRNVRDIGQALGVRYLIEGSVRKDGERVRITARLVRAADDANLWTESYDRPLAELFNTQRDIANAITAALKQPLGLGQDGALAKNRPADTSFSINHTDMETYELFLRGRAGVRARKPFEALPFLDQVVARDPNFAPGWRFLSMARNFADIDRRLRRQAPVSYPESRETLARKVIALAPGSADGYRMLAELAFLDGEYLEEIGFLEQALTRDPGDTEVLRLYAEMLFTLGYLKEALNVAERLRIVDPLARGVAQTRAEVLAANGDIENAVRDYLAVAPQTAQGAHEGRFFLPQSYAGLGRFTEAIGWLTRDSLEPGTASPPKALADAAIAVLKAAANKTEAPLDLPQFDRELVFVHAYTRTPERMLAWHEANLRSGNFNRFFRYVWWPMPSSLRRTERFKSLLRDAGIVEIWEARGWPDRCHSTTGDDFECN